MVCPGLMAGGSCTMSVDGKFWIISDRIFKNIRKVVVSSLQVTTIAGPQVSSAGCQDGFNARFHEPAAHVLTSQYAFIVDRIGLTVRRLDLGTYEVSTFAGLCQTPGTADGVGINARFTFPTDITMQGAYLYVPDVTLIRKIHTTTAAVSTIQPTAVAGTYFVFMDFKVSTTCTPCTPGYACTSGAEIPCSKNFFCHAGISIPCPQQTITLAAGATSYLSCHCPAGTYGRVTSATTSSCFPCPIGNFCNATATSCSCL